MVKINIEEARPPTEVKAAYDDVIKAREDLERLVNEAQAYSNGVIPEARGAAQRLREEAEVLISLRWSRKQRVKPSALLRCYTEYARRRLRCNA